MHQTMKRSSLEDAAGEPLTGDRKDAEGLLPHLSALNAVALRMPFGVPTTAGNVIPPLLPGVADGTNPVHSAALYQNPLYQAALRQQQLQLISHIASINPYIHGPLPHNLAAALSRQHTTSFLPPQQSAAAAAAAAAFALAPNNSNRSSARSDLPLAVDNVEAYKDYLTRLVHLQQQQLSSTNSSITSTSVPLNEGTLLKPTLKSTSPIMEAKLNNSNSSSKMAAVDLNASPASIHVRSVSLDESKMKKKSINIINDSSNTGTSSTSSPTPTPTTTSTSSSAAAFLSSRRNTKDSSVSSSSNHASSNGRDRVFTCKICNRSFGYKHVLQNHERTHTGEKPFECKVCRKRFTRDHHLKTHMRLHTGEKPYSCSHCDRQFVQVANLRRHLRVHTGERPYKCDSCESCFSDSNQLKAHLLIHNGEKPFSCDICQNRYRRKHHLVHHSCPHKEDAALMSGLDKKKLEDRMSLDTSNEDATTTISSSTLSGSSLSPVAPALTKLPMSDSDLKRSRQRKAREPKRCMPNLPEEEQDEKGPVAKESKLDMSNMPPEEQAKAKVTPLQTEPEDLSSKASGGLPGVKISHSPENVT